MQNAECRTEDSAHESRCDISRHGAPCYVAHLTCTIIAFHRSRGLVCRVWIYMWSPSYDLHDSGGLYPACQRVGSGEDDGGSSTAMPDQV